MTTTVTDAPILVRLRKALDEMYGNRLERVVLYGSRARGGAHADSDYDVAVFLHDMADRGPELHRLARIFLSGRLCRRRSRVAKLKCSSVSWPNRNRRATT